MTAVCFFPCSLQQEDGQVPQIGEGGHCPLGAVRGQEGHHCQELRRREQRPPVRACAGGGDRPISAEGDAEHGQEEGNEAVEAKAILENTKLQPHDAHAVGLRVRVASVRC